MNWYPIAYPPTPPRSEPAAQIRAYRKALAGIDIARAISRTSGGIGKKLDSARARRKSAHVPYGVSAQLRTQSYSLLSISYLNPSIRVPL